jgi:hypothetical protein
VTTLTSRFKLVGALLAVSTSLQSTVVAYAANSDAAPATQTVAFVGTPETSRFNALEEAVGLRQSEVQTDAPDLTPKAFGSSASNGGLLQSLGPAKMDTAVDSHYINLADLAEGNIPSNGIDLIQRADLIADASPVPVSAPVTLNATITNDPVVAKGRADDLTRQILLKIVELERYNLHYKQEVAKQGRWKGWRYAGLQEVNGALNLAGGIVAVGERGSHLRKSGRHDAGSIHTSVQQNANILGLVGNAVGAAAALDELAINEYHELQARHHGYGPGQARAHVQGLRDQIDHMLAERTALIQVERNAANLQGHANVDDQEGKVLKDMRDQGLLEFQRFHVAARRLLAFQQSQYGFDFARYTINAIGFEFAFLALHKHDRRWNKQAGIQFEVAGALTIFGPVLSRMIGKAVAEGHKRYLHGTVQQAEQAKCDDLVRDKATLDQMCSTAGTTEDAASAIGRASIYGDQSKVFQDELASSTKERNKAKLTATQNIGSGFFVGGCKVTSGVFFNIVGYNNRYNTSSGYSGRVTNDNLFVASVVGLPATTYSMVDTLRIQIMGEINRHKQLAAGTHSTQLINARLAALDDIERRLGGSSTTK